MIPTEFPLLKTVFEEKIREICEARYGDSYLVYMKVDEMDYYIEISILNEALWSGVVDERYCLAYSEVTKRFEFTIEVRVPVKVDEINLVSRECSRTMSQCYLESLTADINLRFLFDTDSVEKAMKFINELPRVAQYLREIARNYKVQGFVIDANAREKIEKARNELEKILSELA